MKSSELRRLVQEYHTLLAKQAKSYDHRVYERLKEIKHRYYHETGNDLTTK
jgi:hypothetical protein